MNKLITDGVYQNARVTPSKPALITKGATHTYEMLAHAVKRRAAYLTRNFSIQKGDMIMLAMPNSHLFVEWFLAICDAGGAAVPVNPSLTYKEWETIVRRYHPVLIIADQQVAATGQLGLGTPIIDHNTAIEVDQLTPIMQAHKAAHSDSDIFYMALSSGTTGTPKGILRSHRSWVTSFYAMSAEFGLGRQDAILLPGPLYYSATLISMLHLFSLGGSVQLMEHFDAAEALRMMQTGRITSVFMVPTMYAAVVKEWENQLERENGIHPPVKTLITAGSKMEISLKERVQKVFAHSTLYEYYGAAEIGFVSVQAGQGDPGAVGHAFHGVEIEIRNDNGDVLPVGNMGEIFARSEMMAEGYFPAALNKCEHNAPVWKSAGDLGRMDSRGILHLMGRKSDMFISGGINIHPAEIESALYEVDFIEEAAVFGVADSYWGEKCVAVVKLAAPPYQWQETLCQVLRDRLSAYKIPKTIFQVETMPYNSAGKIHKTELASRYLEETTLSAKGEKHE